MKRSVEIAVLLMWAVMAYCSDGAAIVLNGSVEHSGLFALKDEKIGAQKQDFPYLSNTYIGVGLQSEWVDAGLRLEVMPRPLLGYETGFAGAGIGNMYVTGKTRWGSLTVGDVYAQFGSGLTLRLYEERSLGIDNSLRGAKLVLKPYKGISFQAIGGKQRVYWNCYDDHAFGFNYTEGAVLGANVDLDLNEWSSRLQEAGVSWRVGGSYVSRYQPRDTVFYQYDPPLMYNLPRWVAAGEVRTAVQVHGWRVGVEYAYKANDPSADNGYSYRHGEALLLSAGYSKKGLSVLVQVKRSENMSFRSDRQLRGIGGRLNHLPAFTTTHTYALCALYPYATQLQGEWAVQGEVRYLCKKGTAMGGKYGTQFALSGAHIRGLKSNWWAWGDETYYTDVHIEMQKKLSKQWRLNAMYMYQTYNQQVVEGHGDLIRAHIGVVEAQYKVNKQVSMRAEVQYLYSKLGEGQWVYGLYELTLFGQLMLSGSDMYNIRGEHYYMASACYQRAGHRLQAGFGRTRAGYNCAGGVCRYMPAQKGATLSYTYQW